MSTDKYKTDGTISFVKHPETGKPYISVKASYSDVELKDGFAMCFDFAPAETVSKADFMKGQLKGGDTNYPVNFVVQKGETAPLESDKWGPASTFTAGDSKKRAFKKCTVKDLSKHKEFDKLIDISPSSNFNVDSNTGEFEWRRPICDGKSETCEGL